MQSQRKSQSKEETPVLKPLCDLYSLEKNYYKAVPIHKIEVLSFLLEGYHHISTTIYYQFAIFSEIFGLKTTEFNSQAM